ncbi:hypothetical protein ABPG72_015849, partial [Tetrahymena utriculariae]
MNRSQEIGFQCKRHKQNDIQYIKVKNIQDDEDIFFCVSCPISNKNFCMQDCTVIKEIFNWNEESYIINFLPFNDDAIQFQQTQSLFSNQLQNLINKSNFTKEFHELFPPNNIDLIPSLEFERIPKQINDSVILRQNNQIEFIVQDQQQQQQFFLKQILNKESEYFLKFILRNHTGFVQSNLPNAIQTNQLNNNQQTNQNYFCNNNFQVELFNKNDEKIAFKLNLADFFQNSQSKNSLKQNLQPINQKNFNFDHTVQGSNSLEQKIENDFQIQNLNQIQYQNNQNNQNYQDFQNNQQNFAQIPEDLGQNNNQNNMLNQNFYNYNQLYLNVAYQPNLNQYSNYNQNFNYMFQQQQSISQIPNLNNDQNNMQNQDFNKFNQQQQNVVADQLNLNQNNYMNNNQKYDFNNLNQQQSNVEQLSYLNQNYQNNMTNYNFSNYDQQQQNFAQNLYQNQNQNNLLQQNFEPQIYQGLNTQEENIKNLNLLNLSEQNFQQQPQQFQNKFKNQVQNQKVPERVTQITNQRNNQQNFNHLPKNNTLPSQVKPNQACLQQPFKKCQTVLNNYEINDNQQISHQDKYSQNKMNKSLKGQTIQENLNYQKEVGHFNQKNDENIAQNQQILTFGQLNFNQKDKPLSYMNNNLIDSNPYLI